MPTVKKELSEYVNIVEYAIDTLSSKQSSSDRKLDLLESINKKFGTNYNRNAINNWLAGRKPTPQRIKDHWVDVLIKSEVSDSAEIISLINRKI